MSFVFKQKYSENELGIHYIEGNVRFIYRNANCTIYELKFIRLKIAEVTSIQSLYSKSNFQGYKGLAILFSQLAELLTAGNDFKELILKKFQTENQTIRKEHNNHHPSVPVTL